MDHDHLVRWNRWVPWEGVHQDDLAVKSWRGSRSWGCFSGSAPLSFQNLVKFLPGRDAWKDRECISGEVVSLNYKRKAEKLEYEQQRELWDWNTMNPRGVFSFVWEQAFEERETGKGTEACVGIFFCSTH